MSLTETEIIELRGEPVRGPCERIRHVALTCSCPLAGGLTWSEIRGKLDCSDSYIDRWSKCFAADRLAGLFARHAGRERYNEPYRVEARVLAHATKHTPLDGSTRKLAAELGGDISHMTVTSIWAKHGIKPHRLESYLASDDTKFETTAADVIGLHLNPPQHAAVFSVDEKTTIQTLDREDHVLPPSPGRAERHDFEYFRHRTHSLYAAFNTMTGEVLGKTATRHTSADFVANQPRGKEIHALSTTSRRTRPCRSMCFSSRLNQVELWFTKIERNLIASVSDLKRKLMPYIRYYVQPKPV